MGKHRGSLADFPYIASVIFVAILGLWVSFYIIGQLAINPTIAASVPATAAVASIQSQVSLFDEAILLFTVCASVASIILAFQIRTHPAYYVAAFIATFALNFFYVGAANALIVAGSTDPLVSVAVLFPLSLWIITSLPKLAMIFSFLIAFVGMARPASVSAVV